MGCEAGRHSRDRETAVLRVLDLPSRLVSHEEGREKKSDQVGFCRVRPAGWSRFGPPPAGAMGISRHRPSVPQSPSPSLRPPVCPSVPHPSVPQSPSLSFSPSVPQSVPQSLTPPVHPSVPQSLSPPVCLSVPQSPSPSLSPIYSHRRFRDELNRRSQTCLQSANQKLDSPKDPGPDRRHKTLLPGPPTD